MASNGEAVSPHGGATTGAAWGRVNSNTSKDIVFNVSEEEAPLLGNDGTQDGLEWEGAADFINEPWWNKPSMWWILPNFLLFALAFGGTIVPKLNLILSLVCREYLFDRSRADPSFIFAPVILEGENSQCRDPEIQALVTRFMMYITVTTGFFSAIMAPKLGALSDRYGRKNFMIISSCGLICSEVITILIYNFPDTLHYNWLLLGAFVDGISGSFTVNMALTHAYAADCTAPPKRAVAFGYFHACLFTGVAIGPLIAAFMIRMFGHIIVIFYGALIVHAFFILFIFFVVPESLSKKRQQLAQEKYAAAEESAGPEGYSWLWALRRGNILQPLKILYPTGAGSSGRLRANLILLSAVDTISFGVAMGGMTVIIYYMGYQFNWDTADISEFVSIVNVVRVSGLLCVLPLLNYLVRTRRANRQRRESGFAIPERNSGSDHLDLGIIRAAMFLELICFLGYALARTGGLFLVAAIIGAGGGIGSPTLQSALTKHVPQERVGQLLGAMGLLHALARIVAPLIFSSIYAATVGSFPQAVFVVLTGCFGTAFVVSWFITPHVYLEESSQTTANPPRTGEPNIDSIVDEEVAGF